MRMNKLLAVSILSAMGGTLALPTLADAAGTLSIARREDGTTFDPIKTAQNIDFWVFSNVYDVLVRVDKSGTKLEPGLAESWEVSPDGTVYTFKMRDAKFEDGSPLTAKDAAFSLTRIRDNKDSLWADTYKVIKSAEAKDDKTLVVTLNQPVVPFLATLAMPGASILSEKAVTSLGEAAYASKPLASGAFGLADWKRGDTVTLKKNPNFWQADRVKLDGVKWISVVDDNTRMLKLQAGEVDCAIFVPFSKVAELKQDPNLTILIEPSTREDHLLINHEKGPLGKKEVREALDHGIDKKSIVDTVTFGIAKVANSYIPEGALYHNDANLVRPYEPEKAKQLLKDAGAEGLTITHLVNAGDVNDEQIAVLLQQQLAKVGITVNIQKMDASQTWQTEVDGNYETAVNYWTNDIIDPDQKTTFVLGHDANMNYMTRYKNDKIKTMVAAARVEADPKKREAMYKEIQRIAKEDVHWIDLYYSPYINGCRKSVSNFYQNPLGRFFLEDTDKAQ
jgi:peptide/nickel transport system substrate-binding protein